MRYDAVVIGGGPAGCRTAALMASEYDVLILEEHPQPGLPVQCAGLLSDEALSLTGVKPDILNDMYGARIVFPDGNETTVRSSKRLMRVVDRAQMDSMMADAARDAGAEIQCGTKFTGSVPDSEGRKVNHTNGTAECRVLVGADGPRSTVSKELGNPGPKENLVGIQAEVRKPSDDDYFTSYLGSEHAPGFFTWEVPCGDFTRIGLCTVGEPPFPYLKKYLKREGLEDRVIRYGCGRIPLGFRGRSYGDACALVGDAAAQVKPVSGGGVHPGLRSAAILADYLSLALNEGDLSAVNLSGYESRWKAEVGADLEKGYKLRRRFVKMSDGDLSLAGRFARRDDVRSVLNDIDIDHPDLVVRRILKSPRMSMHALALLGRLAL